LRDHSHFSPDNTGYCAHCGQPLPAEHAVPVYGARRTNRTGIVITVLLHLLLVAVYLLQPKLERHAPPPSGATMVYIAPLPGKPKPKPPQQQAPKKAPKVPQVVPMQRLPNTITLPHEKPVEVTQAEPKPVTRPPEVDMQAYIDARRKQRGATEAQSAQPAEESENDRATRIAQANIAAANGKSRGDDQNDTGGVFSLSNKTFHSADLKFRGWNTNFKRRWLTQLTVEQGAELDVETAVVKKMIELIRKEKPGDFEWESQRLGRVVKMSARPEDSAELQAFLFKEMFPEYRPPGRQASRP